ncbi:MAG: hypothetical protein ACFFG0_05490 [Candidatus Thorarchaeota archaeon]
MEYLINDKNLTYDDCEELAWQQICELSNNTHQTDWSDAVDVWCQWVRRDSKTWEAFVYWLSENDFRDLKDDSLWNFFFGHDEVSMAREWVDEEERASYLEAYRKKME